MRSLLATELRRFLVRPLFRVAAGAAVLAILVTAVAILVASHKDSPEHIRLLELRRDRSIQRCIDAGFNPPLSSVGAEDRREFCVAEGLPAPRFTFRLTGLLDIVEGAGFKGTAIPLVILSFLLGASFVGAEWQVGAVATLLAWTPGRLQVLIAKVAVPAVVLFVGALVAQALLAFALVPVAVLKGTTEGIDAAWLVSFVSACLRVDVLAAIAAGLGASVAMIGRGTAAALGVAAIYAVIEVFIRGFEDPQWQRWLLGENASAFVTAQRPAAGFSPAGAFLVVSAVVAATIVLAAQIFKRRDVV